MSRSTEEKETNTRLPPPVVPPGAAQISAMSTPGEPTLVLTQLEVYGKCCQSEVTLVKRKLEVLPNCALSFLVITSLTA